MPMKKRKVRIYTDNTAVVIFADFVNPLNQLLRDCSFLDDDDCPAIADRIFEAMKKYSTEYELNPDRRQPSKQLIDRHELIECMKELEARLPAKQPSWHVPQWLWSAVRDAYVPETSRGMRASDESIRLLMSGENPARLNALNDLETEQNTLRGKASLGEEIEDLMLRIRRLREDFERVPIPVTDRTNPGKPERKILMDCLAAIFDEFSGAQYQDGDRSQRASDQKHFMTEVLNVFHIKTPRHKLVQ